MNSVPMSQLTPYYVYWGFAQCLMFGAVGYHCYLLLSRHPKPKTPVLVSVVVSSVAIWASFSATVIVSTCCRFDNEALAPAMRVAGYIIAIVGGCHILHLFHKTYSIRNAVWVIVVAVLAVVFYFAVFLWVVLPYFIDASNFVKLVIRLLVDVIKSVDVHVVMWSTTTAPKQAPQLFCIPHDCCILRV